MPPKATARLAWPHSWYVKRKFDSMVTRLVPTKYTPLEPQEDKLSAYFSEMVLVDQPFIKDPSLTIQGLIDKAVQKFGEKIEVTKFVRFSLFDK